MGSLRILDIKNDCLLISGSNAKCPGNIFIYNTISKELQEILIPPICENDTLKIIEKDLESSVIELNSNVHIVLLKPKTKSSERPLPLILVPHGGPNSVYSVDYVFYPTVLAKLGYAVASSN